MKKLQTFIVIDSKGIHKVRKYKRVYKETGYILLFWFLFIIFIGSVSITYHSSYFNVKAQDVVEQPVEAAVAGQTLLVSVPTPTPLPEYWTTPEKIRVKNLIIEIWGDDASIGLALAQCESGFQQTVPNQKSTARGVFQFLEGTWKAERTRIGRSTDLNLRYDAFENVLTGYSLFQRNGLRQPWAESVGCVEKVMGQKYEGR